jgi:hypothetical protein
MSRAWVIAIAVAAAACSARGPAGLVGPGGGSGPPDGSGAPDDAGVPDGTGTTGGPGDGGSADAGNDPTDLATICGGTAPVTLDDWEDCYLKRTCEWEVGCPTENTFRDAADCIESWDGVQGGKLAADRRARKRAVEQGRASIDVAAFTQCLVRTSATRCDTALHDAACLTRFTGTIADGAGCFTGVDCASPGAVCAPSDCTGACCLGTCQRKFRLGEACQLFDSCEPGLRCTGRMCVSGDAGTPCARGSVNQCDFGTFCDSQTLRCTPTLAPGSACTQLLQCGGDETCVGLSVSSADPGQCQRVSRPGDACDNFCFGNLYCDAASSTCRALPALGQACTELIPCAGANTICDSGRCVVRSDVAVACSGQTCLPGLFCTSELGDSDPVCAERRAVNQACAAPSHCESFLCSGTSGQHGACLPWSDTCP